MYLKRGGNPRNRINVKILDELSRGRKCCSGEMDDWYWKSRGRDSLQILFLWLVLQEIQFESSTTWRWPEKWIFRLFQCGKMNYHSFFHPPQHDQWKREILDTRHLSCTSFHRTILSILHPSSRFIRSGINNAPCCCGRVWTHAGLRGECEEPRPKIQRAQIQHALCARMYAPRFQGIQHVNSLSLSDSQD